MEKPKDTLNPLEYLRNAPLTYSEMLDEQPLKWFITEFDEKQALNEAEYRFLKWATKRGKQLANGLNDNMRARVSYGQVEKVFLEILMNGLLGSLGLAGGRFLDYSTLGYAVAKKARIQKGKTLEATVKGLISRWKITREIEEEKAHIVALASAKMVNYVKRKYSNIVFSEKGKEGSEAEKIG